MDAPTPDTPPPPPPEPTPPPAPAPSSKGHELRLYLLVAGACLGLLMGPSVMGRLAPDFYSRLFVGDAEHVAALRQEELALRDQLQRLEASGATPEALREHRDTRVNQIIPLVNQVMLSQAQRRQFLQSVSQGLMAAVVMLLFANVWRRVQMRAPDTDPWLHRVTTATYAIAAVWLALVFATPAGTWTDATWLVLAVAVGASLLFAHLTTRRTETTTP